MKYTTTLISLLTLLSTSTAQSLADVPGCASAAAISSFTSSGCSVDDAACICKNQSFLASLLPLIEGACSPEELKKTVDITTKFCSDAGVPLAVTTSASTAMPSSTVAAPMATASNGTLTPGNSTQGGVPQPPSPTPKAAPESGVAGSLGLLKEAGMLGALVVGALMVF
ncbi:MAG: hypothetical protein L6R40_001597 [Gallowayella cf. fulva]|nr:MAG: hypothetical protein L6R40_001597 [Xanthomendoza cf. fulva]